LYCFSVKLHELASVLGHELEDNVHLLGCERAARLKLVGEGGEDDGVHATEAHAVVVGHVGCTLLISRLVAVDGQQAALSPAHVGGEFRLQRFECVLLIHHTHIIGERYGTVNA
jgi:hypothetical protein